MGGAQFSDYVSSQVLYLLYCTSSNQAEEVSEGEHLNNHLRKKHASSANENKNDRIHFNSI